METLLEMRGLAVTKPKSSHRSLKHWGLASCQPLPDFLTFLSRIPDWGLNLWRRKGDRVIFSVMPAGSYLVVGWARHRAFKSSAP